MKNLGDGQKSHIYNNKIIRSRDAIFFEDQTIEDIDKAEKIDSQSNESLVDSDLVFIAKAPISHEGTQDNDGDNDHDQNDHHGVDVMDAPVDEFVVDQQPIPAQVTTSNAPETSLRRSTREKQQSMCYPLLCTFD